MATTRTSSPESTSERRQQIVAIATRLFAAQGYAATTVRDIADEAGILSGSLYHHFSSKEALLEEIVHSYLDDLIAQFTAIVDKGDDPATTLDALIISAFETIGRIPHTVALYQNEATFLLTLPEFSFLIDSAARIETIWTDQIIAGQRAGQFRDSIDAALAYRFFRDGLWSTVRWYRPGGRHTIEAIGQNYLDLMHSGMLAR